LCALTAGQWRLGGAREQRGVRILVLFKESRPLSKRQRAQSWQFLRRPPLAARPFAVGVIAHLETARTVSLKSKSDKDGEKRHPRCAWSTRLSQGFCWYDFGGDGDRDRVGQIYAAQFVARRIQIRFDAGE
jgi:hypothetical protein